MSDKNKSLVRRWIDAMDKQNFEFADEIFSPDFIFHLPGRPEPMKFEEYKQFIRSVYAAFPDLSHKIEDLIAEGDKVVVRLTDLATHKGDFMGIAATGKEVSLGAIVICRFAEGKCVEAWEEADYLGMMQQLGAVPAMSK